MSREEVENIQTQQTPMKVPRNFYLTRADLNKHGFTDRCPGCSSVLRGISLQPHSEGCRKRFEELLKGDAKIQHAKERLQEHKMRIDNQGGAKRPMLDELEEKILGETDPVKLGPLYEQ